MPPTRVRVGSLGNNSLTNTTIRCGTVRSFRAPTGLTEENFLTRPTLPSTRSLVSTFLRDRLAGDTEVRAYYDEGERSVVAVVEAVGSPHPDLSTFVTASLHATENWLDDRDIRVELMVVGRRGDAGLGNLVATAGFFVQKNGWLAAPGVVFPDLLRDYVADTTTPHLMWSEPFDFDGLSTCEIQGLTYPVHVLQAVPITDEERDLLVRHGYDALESALTSAGVLHFDLHRESAI